MLPRENRVPITWLFVVSGGTVLGLFLWQGRIGFSLWDEGYLWYGAQRVLAGEVPMRDFSSYDPGRYYWSAALMGWWGDSGVVALRAAAAVFQAIGLFVGLAALAATSTQRQRLFWLLAAITIAAWMAPPHRLFDSSLAIALIATLSYLAAKPSWRRYFGAGLVVGLAAVFGRNHGVYGVVGTLILTGYLAFHRELGLRLGRALAAWLGGIAVGYLPILLSIALVPGFAQAFWESLAFLLEIRATDITLPVPWPWREPATVEIARWQHLLIGTFFIALLAYTLFAFAWLLRRRGGSPASPVLVASAALALPYTHYAFPRADLEHLALGVFPLLFGSLTMLSNLRATLKWPLGVLLCVASVLTMLPHHAAWNCRPSQDCVPTNVAGTNLPVDRGTAGHLWLLERLAEDFSLGGRTFIAAPYWPGAYAALQRRSPMWDIYALFPASPASERAEIERIRAADPGFAVIYDASLDHRDDLSFDSTHPLLDRYIRDHFEPVSGYTPNPRYRIYRSKLARP